MDVWLLVLFVSKVSLLWTISGHEGKSIDLSLIVLNHRRYLYGILKISSNVSSFEHADYFFVPRRSFEMSEDLKRFSWLSENLWRFFKLSEDLWWLFCIFEDPEDLLWSWKSFMILKIFHDPEDFLWSWTYFMILANP